MEHFLSFYMYNRFLCVNMWLATQSKAWINSGFLRDSNLVQRSTNRPHSRYSPSSHALIKDLRDKSNVTWFLRGQTSDKINRYKKRQSSLFQTTEKKEIFLLKTTIKNYGGKLSLLLFLDAVAIVDVLTGSCYGVKLVKTRTVQTFWLT